MNCKKKVKQLYLEVQEQLQRKKDPWGMINHAEIRLILCRLFHSHKCRVNKIIKEELIEEYDMIEIAGKNQLGLFYRVK